MGYRGLARRRDVLVVAEAPGRLGAVRTGLPLSGDATGRNFERLLAGIGWRREQIWVTNAVLCWPASPAGLNRRPTRSELRNCSSHLARLVQAIDPLVVLPLGLTALEALRGLGELPRAPLRELVGRRLPWNGRLVIPTYHPSPRVMNTVRSFDEQLSDLQAVGAFVSDLKVRDSGVSTPEDAERKASR